jgi:hypothetical protein
MHLRTLKLPAMLSNYKRLADDITQPVEYLVLTPGEN